MSGKAQRIGRRLQRFSTGCDKGSAIPDEHGAEPGANDGLVMQALVLQHLQARAAGDDPGDSVEIR